MKKNILIILLTLTTAFSIFYAFIKADEATKAATEAQIQKTRADEFQNLAEIQEERAIEAAAEATKQQRLAEKALAECESSK